jgi:hypothetical protein
MLRAILWVMRECGTVGVPSFHAVRKKQAEISKDFPSLNPRPHSTVLGNKFHMVHPVDLLALVSTNVL